LAEREIAEWNRQRAECQRHLAEKYQLENQITRSAYLDRTEMTRAFALIADAMRSRIMASPLDRSAKEDILREIAGIPLAIEEVARGQTRLPRAKGTRPESEGEER
jgi:hypothetical protein